MILDGLSVALLLAFIGALLVVAEVFFPSGGVLGFLSAAAFLGAIYSAYTAGGWLYGLGFATAEVLLAPVVIWYALKLLPHTPLGRVLVSSAPTSEEVEPDDERRDLVGRQGVARTKMLPAGSVEVDGAMLDAVAQGQAIEPGEAVRIVEVRGNRVVVRRAPAEADPATRVEPDAETLGLDSLGIESIDFSPPDPDSPQR